MKLYETRKGALAVVFSDRAQKIKGKGVTGAGLTLDADARAHDLALRGQYGEEMKDYAEACKRAGVPCQCGYRGIEASGDYGSLFPIVKAWPLGHLETMPDIWTERAWPATDVTGQVAA